MTTSAHLAIDLGAESGRGIVGVLNATRLVTLEVARFSHAPRDDGGVLRWDRAAMMEGVRGCLNAAHAWCVRQGTTLASVGVDAWGVDFALVTQGEVGHDPMCYRDPVHAASMNAVRDAFADGLYERTGLSLAPINTLVQLRGLLDRSRALLDRAERLLLIPDLVHYELSGVAVNERTIASTTQMLDPETAAWDGEVIGRCLSPSVLKLLTQPTSPGTVLGELSADFLRDAGAVSCAGVRVVLPGSHDTASAVAGVPARGEPGTWAFLSSGTWSILGVERSTPIRTAAAHKAGMNNELGIDGTVRFLKNIVGLWLIQELRRDLHAGGSSLTYAELADAARASPGCRTLVHASWSPLAAPGRMVAKLRAFARASGQPVPVTPGELARCCLDSLALAYREAIATIESLTGTRPVDLYIVGGGTRHDLLNDLTAGATRVRVVLGPTEASAVGNLLTQAAGLGVLPGSTPGHASLGAIRDAGRGNAEWATIEPREADQRLGTDGTMWSRESARYAGLEAVACERLEIES